MSETMEFVVFVFAALGAVGLLCLFIVLLGRYMGRGVRPPTKSLRRKINEQLRREGIPPRDAWGV